MVAATSLNVYFINSIRLLFLNRTTHCLEEDEKQNVYGFFHQIFSIAAPRISSFTESFALLVPVSVPHSLSSVKLH